MKLRLTTLWIATLMCCIFASAETVILPLGQNTEMPWSGKWYTIKPGESEPADNWMDLDFNEDGWKTLLGPIGRGYNIYFATKWDAEYSTYWLRREFNLEETNIRLRLKVCHNKSCEVYINGHNVYGCYDDETSTQSFYVPRAYLLTGKNMLAMKVTNIAESSALLDCGLNADSFLDLNIDVTEPGSMSNLILDETENFVDVNGLTVSGTLNDADLHTIYKRLTNLTELDLTNTTVTEIPDQFFRYRDKLCVIKLPSKLEKIGKSAFEGCTNLIEMDLPETVTTIGSSAFQWCKILNRVKLSPLLTSLDENTFRHNYNLQELQFGEGLTTIGSACFRFCGRLDNVMLPSTMKSINIYAFSECFSLKNLQLNEGLVETLNGCFDKCITLEEITLPSTLSTGGRELFQYCDSLKKVTCLSLEPPLVTNTLFKYCDMTSKELYVPALTLNLYQEADGWNLFPTIKPVDMLPDFISVGGDFHLSLSGLPADYKPEVALIRNNRNTNYPQYGKFTVEGEGTLSMKIFTQIWDPYYEFKYYITNNYSTCYTALVNNVHMRADKIETYLSMFRDNWKFMTMLYDVKMSDITPILEGDTYWSIMKYDGLKRANGETADTWMQVGKDEILKAGQGYIFYNCRYETMWEDECSFLFPALNNDNKNNIFEADDVTVALTEYSSEFAHNRSWNLIGNPYPCFYDIRFMDFESPITTWVPRNNTYQAYSPLDDSYILRPGDAFFVQKPVEQSGIVFNKEGRQTDLVVREIEAATKAKSINASNRIKINLTINYGENTDQTRIVFNENAEMGYDSRDASKFLSLDEYVPQLYSIQNGVSFSINERPTGSGTVNLGYLAPFDANYSISLTDSDLNEVWLEDTYTNTLVRLGQGESYEFDTEKGTIADRFVLRLNNSLTGISSINGDKLDNEAFYTIDGIKIDRPNRPGLYIHNGQKVYIK